MAASRFVKASAERRAFSTNGDSETAVNGDSGTGEVSYGTQPPVPRQDSGYAEAGY
jgi:hypothetical protein